MITKEQFKKVLDAVFPWGYTGSLDNWEHDWFLGWAYINEDSQRRDVMCVNMDGDMGIDFWLIRCEEEVSIDEVTGAINGIMHVLMPEMTSDSPFKKVDSVICYELPREE